MPAKSRNQLVAMRIAEHAPEKLFKRNKNLLSMSHSQLVEFTHTPSKGLPKKVKKSKNLLRP